MPSWQRLHCLDRAPGEQFIQRVLTQASQSSTIPFTPSRKNSIYATVSASP